MYRKHTKPRLCVLEHHVLRQVFLSGKTNMFGIKYCNQMCTESQHQFYLLSIHWVYVKELSIMLAAHLAFRRLPAACFDVATIHCTAWPQITFPLFTTQSHLMFGRWWLAARWIGTQTVVGSHDDDGWVRGQRDLHSKKPRNRFDAHFSRSHTR